MSSINIEQKLQEVSIFFNSSVLSLSLSFSLCMIYRTSGYFTSLPDMRTRSRDRLSATARSRRSRRCHGRTGLKRWSGTTSCNLPFRRSSTYPPITRTIRMRIRRWAIRTYPRPMRNTHIATCLESRRGQITCRPKVNMPNISFQCRGARGIVKSILR